MSSTTHTIEFGVLYASGYQTLDAAGPIDYLSMFNKSYIEAFSVGQPELVDKAPIINWHFISTTGDLEPIHASSGPAQIPTATFETCPPLDYLLVPGADARFPYPDDCTEWIKKQFASVKALLTVCSGSMHLAHTGILDGLRCATNKFALRMFLSWGLPEAFSKVRWVGDQRFVVDGKVWSAAGVTAGLDLAAEFARVHFDPALVKLVKELAEFESSPAEPDPFAYLLEGIDLK